MSAQRLHAYIDESGDEGFAFASQQGGRGASRWFIIAAALVAAEDDRAVAAVVNKTKDRLWPGRPDQKAKPLHWTSLNHARKRVLVDEIVRAPVRFVAVAFDKQHAKLQRERFDSRAVRKASPRLKSVLYNYATRFLTERLCKIAKSERKRVDLIFENRASLSTRDVNAYLSSLASAPGPYGTPTIPPNTLGEVVAQGKQTTKLLQLADACAGAVRQALEINQYGQVDPTYLLDLLPRFHHGETYWGYGLKLFPGKPHEYANSEPAYSWMQRI